MTADEDPAVHVQAGRGLHARLSFERRSSESVLRWGDGVGDEHLRTIVALLNEAEDAAIRYELARAEIVW